MKLLLDHVLPLLIKLSQRGWEEFQAESGILSFDDRKGRDSHVLFVFLLTIHLFLLPTTLLAYADRADFKVGETALTQICPRVLLSVGQQEMFGNGLQSTFVGHQPTSPLSLL